jgi:hypothetical protein
VIVANQFPSPTFIHDVDTTKGKSLYISWHFGTPGKADHMIVSYYVDQDGGQQTIINGETSARNEAALPFLINTLNEQRSPR